MNRNTMNIDKTSKDISTGQGSIGSNVKSTAHHEPQHEDERPVEDWSTAGIGNAFLFGKVMTANPDLLLELLQYSLPEYHIQKIIDAQREADVKLSIDSHGVRLDVLLSDDKGRRIDVEMQMRNEKNIPKRMRYYEGSIDQTILEKGQNYNKLGDLVILFITPFDPFETSGFYRYTFRNTCQEDKDLLLGDGVTKVVLNAAGRIGDISPDLKGFLQLVAGDAEPGQYSSGSFVDRVQKQVHIARRNAKWRKEYMDWEMTLRNEREKGREEERANTEKQRKRAEVAEARVETLEEEIRKLKELVEKMRSNN